LLSGGCPDSLAVNSNTGFVPDFRLLLRAGQESERDK
jgi:hypothetical protein